MKDLAERIGQALHTLEKDLLPKATKPPFQAQDADYLQARLTELRRVHEQSLQDPVFSIRFLGDTQNGKSTLINALLGRKVLPEGHVGACSATIVRCRFFEQPNITVHFRYSTEEQFLADLNASTRDAELALQEENSPADRRETVCKLLGRFIRLFDIDKIENPEELITTCRQRALSFPEKGLLGKQQTLVASAENEARIHENLSARGRVAFIVDECLIQGEFQKWHPSMELVDMPGTNAFNPWDDQVNARLKQKVGGLAIVTNGTQLNDTVMEWFKESSILPEIAGASKRNQVRVFILKTFVDQLNLPDTNAGESLWQQTQRYCAEIETHLRTQVMDLVHQRYSAPNEIEVLADFVRRMPVHFLSAKVHRNLADDASKNRVLANPTSPQNLPLFAAFQRFNQDPYNTGIPILSRQLHDHTEEFIKSHYRRKVELDFEKEVGLVAQFFRLQRVGIEQRLAQKGEFVLEVDGEVRRALRKATQTYRESTERKVVEIKNHFDDEVGALLEKVAERFGKKTRNKLEDWLELHWASLRCAGRKNGQHITSRGYEIDFNGSLADLCVEALNSSWIDYRSRLRKLLYDDLLMHFLPQLESIVAQAKGQDPARIDLIEATYQKAAESARHELELQVEKYDADAEPFDALRSNLALQIRAFLSPAYRGIASEAGRGSSARMRHHLNEGVSSSIQEIPKMVKKVVKENWRSLAASIEARINEFFDTIEASLNAQGKHLKTMAEHPSAGDEQWAQDLKGLEKDAERLAGKGKGRATPSGATT